MSHIIPNYYLSSVVYAKDQYFLNKNNIKYILVVGKELNQYFPKNIIYKQINISDKPQTKIIDFFVESFEFILYALKNKKNILVHCYGGQSRSVSVTIAFLMFFKKLNYDIAYKIVKEIHPRTEPNPGFIAQLKQWEKVLEIYYKEKQLSDQFDKEMIKSILQKFELQDPNEKQIQLSQV